MYCIFCLCLSIWVCFSRALSVSPSLSLSLSLPVCLIWIIHFFYIHMAFYSFHFGHIKFKQKWKHWNANSIILIHNPHIDCMSGWMDECMNEYINFYWLECNTHILSSPYQNYHSIEINSAISTLFFDHEFDDFGCYGNGRKLSVSRVFFMWV